MHTLAQPFILLVDSVQLFLLAIGLSTRSAASASPKALAKAGKTVDVARELGFEMSKVNVNGGAIALGHPIGASGARILVTLIHELEKRNGHLRLCSLCIGGGQGISMIVSNAKKHNKE